MQFPFDPHVLPAVFVKPCEFVRIIPPSRNGCRLESRATHPQHECAPFAVLQHTQPHGKGGVFQVAGQPHGVSHCHGAVGLLGLEDGPIERLPVHVVPDSQFKGGVVRVDWQPCFNVLPHRRGQPAVLCGFPYLRLHVANRPGHAPDAGVRMAGVVVQPDFPQVNGAAGFEVDVQDWFCHSGFAINTPRISL